MPSGLRKTSGNHFEIYYEAPFGGVATNSDPADIQPNQMVLQQGVVGIDGVLAYSNLVADPARFIFGGRNPDSFPYIIFEMNGQLYAIDQYGYVYVYLNQATPTSATPALFRPFNTPILPHGSVPVVASDGPWASQPPTAVKVINGIAYIANYARHSTYTYDGAYAFTLVSNYVGGKIMGVLDNYLIQFNTNNIVDGPQPTRINWSGPSKFSTWDPAIDRTAGFNTLPSVEDQLTGFFSYASVGVATTQKGLVELSPTGIGIQPFNFTTLWTSDVGQGCIYPSTVTQYGQKGFLITDSGVYNVSTGAGFTDISGSAKRAILNCFQTSNLNFPVGNPFPAAAVVLYFYNEKSPHICYMFCAPSQDFTKLNVWYLDLGTGSWQNAIYDANDLVNKQWNINATDALIGAVDVISTNVQTAEPQIPTFINALTMVVVSINSTAGGQKTVIMSPYRYSVSSDDTVNNYAGILKLQFKIEEIKLGRQPTIRRALVKAYGSGTLTLSINGVQFGQIVLDGTTNVQVYKSPFGKYTGESPQLTITSTNFKGVIVKVMLAGTFADGEID